VGGSFADGLIVRDLRTRDNDRILVCSPVARWCGSGWRPGGDRIPSRQAVSRGCDTRHRSLQSVVQTMIAGWLARASALSPQKPWVVWTWAGIGRRAHDETEIGPGPAEHIQGRNKSAGLAYPSPGLPRQVATPGHALQTELNPVGIAYAGARGGGLRGAWSVWTGRHGEGTKGIVFTSRVETKSPYTFPSGMERSWGSYPG